MAVKRSLWDMILKVVIAVASAVLGRVRRLPHPDQRVNAGGVQRVFTVDYARRTFISLPAINGFATMPKVI